MRQGFSILILFCFVLISASVGYVNGHAKPLDQATGQTQSAVETIDGPSGLLIAAGLHEYQSDAPSDTCSCKEKAGATKFACSVTLAFCNIAEILPSPAMSKARYVISKSASPKSFIDELKRPPRTIL